MASLNRSIKAALITPFVSSLALTCGPYTHTNDYIHHEWKGTLGGVEVDFLLTLKSRSTSIWFWMMGMVFRSFSVFTVLITPSDLCKREQALYPSTIYKRILNVV